MIRWTPPKAPLPTQRWQSREEILKAHLDGLTPNELRSVRPRHYWLRFGCELWKLRQIGTANCNRAQSRVPAGNPDGGQWTSARVGTKESRVMSDARRDSDWKPGGRYAQFRPRGPILINGRWVQPTPAQAARLSVAEAQAR